MEETSLKTNNNSLFDPIMKNTIRNTILENKLRYGHPKKTIRACLGLMTLVKSYIVKWCDSRVSKAGRYTQTDTHTHTRTENITGGVNRSISES